MNNDTLTGDQVFAIVSTYILVIAIVAVGVWVLTAIAAFIVAPDDRPWGFFWCTLLFLGPLGVAVALLAQPRPPEAD